jgi:hypothetical protein
VTTKGDPSPDSNFALLILATLSRKGRGEKNAPPRIHLASQESLSFLLDGRVKPGHDGAFKLP